MLLFATHSFRCSELRAGALPDLQAFLERNPEYHLAVNGKAPGPHEAREEFESLPPAHWPFEKKWMLRFTGSDGEMSGMADVLSNLFVEGVWHIGLFIVATRLHGQGAAYAMYDALEAWMRSQGARWSRLGVVEGNGRAERFWEKVGYVEVRKRLAIEMDDRVNDVRVMAKPLAGATLSEYLAIVARDRPESP